MQGNGGRILDTIGVRILQDTLELLRKVGSVLANAVSDVERVGYVCDEGSRVFAGCSWCIRNERCLLAEFQRYDDCFRDHNY